MVSHRIVVAALVAIGSCCAMGEGVDKLTPAMFPFQKELHPVAETTANVGAAALDEVLLASCDNRYANIRIYNGRGEEVPFLVRTQHRRKEIAREVPCELSRTAFNVLPDNSIEVLYARQEDQSPCYPRAVIFSSRETNYEKQVTVYGSSDGLTWQLLAENVLIFDYSRYMAVRKLRVNIASNRLDHFKLVVSNISESRPSPLTKLMRERSADALLREVETVSLSREDFRIDDLRFVSIENEVVPADTVTRAYTVRAFSVEEDPGNRLTFVRFETHRAPLTAVMLSVATPNFSRKITVEATDSPDEDDWMQLLSVSISRSSSGRMAPSDPKLTFPSPQRFRRYRLTVHNQDSPPLEFSGVKVVGEVREVVFYTDEPGTNRVLYGTAESRPPQYDIGDVLQESDMESVDRHELGVAQLNPDYSPEQVRMRFDGGTLFVPAVLLMVVVLIWTMVRVTKQLGND